MMMFFVDFITATWALLEDAAVYVLFGILLAGLLRVLLNPATVARHLAKGRFSSVVKASLFGIPLPL